MEKILFQPEEPPRLQETISDEDLEKALPKPCGHKILVALPTVEEKYEGTNIIKVRESQHNEQVTSVVALVLDVGPDAYKDKERFPSGPWCAVGDYVLVGPYKGQRFIFGGAEYRIMNDDNVEGIVADPRGYRRV
jgi:co-chaperonin GroES (HSP10)